LEETAGSRPGTPPGHPLASVASAGDTVLSGKMLIEADDATFGVGNMRLAQPDTPNGTAEPVPEKGISQAAVLDGSGTMGVTSLHNRGVASPEMQVELEPETQVEPKSEMQVGSETEMEPGPEPARRPPEASHISQEEYEVRFSSSSPPFLLMCPCAASLPLPPPLAYMHSSPLHSVIHHEAVP